MLSRYSKPILLLCFLTFGLRGITFISAQEKQPDQIALESLFVTTAERKMQEVQRETYVSTVNAAPHFLGQVATNYPGSPVMYGAMNVAGANMAGTGPLDNAVTSPLHHVTSADSFFQFNISPTWKQQVAAELGVPISDEQVFEAWCNLVSNNGNIPDSLLNPASIAARANAWWSPDTRMERPSSSSRSQGDNDFFAMCQIVSLAPEWYPKGLVRINAPANTCLWIRPVSFDGMTSPLWVQRPPDQAARTGGDAVEILNKKGIDLSELAPSQAYIISKELTSALQNSPSVNLYSPDLNQVKPGSSPASQKVAKQQILIVEEARKARRQANKAFRQYFENNPIMRIPPDSNPLQLNIPSLRLTDSPEDLPVDQLKNEMRFWAQHNSLEHRGQRFPSERYQRLASVNAKSTKVIENAAIELINHSTEANVLSLVIHLGLSGKPEFHQAVLARLTNEEIPLPQAPGIRFDSLREDFLLKLTESPIDKNLKLRSTIDEYFEAIGRDDLRLALLSQTPSSHKLPTIITSVLKEKPDIHQVRLAAYLVGKHHPERIMEAAKHAANLPSASRKAFKMGIEQAATDKWLKDHSKSLQKILYP